MEIFELHFNPKTKEHHTFDTFIYEPENTYEKRLGGLYMTGELSNILPKPKEFITNIAKTIKKSFYSLSSSNQEKALSHTLKAVNDFLKEEVKKENVNWLGNLNFAVLSIKGDDLVFTKTGDTKILLLRGGQVNDIGKNLNLEGVDPYPLKVFFNIAEGKLAEDDIVLVLSNNVFEFIKEKGVITALARAKEASAKTIKEMIPHHLFTKGEGSKISGLALIFLLKKKNDKSRLSAILKPSLPSFIGNKAQKEAQQKKPFVFPVPIITKPIKSSLERIKKISLPKIYIPKISGASIEKFTKGKDMKKNILLIGIFVVLLALGFFVFKNVEDKKERDTRTAFNKVDAIVRQAENFLMAENNERADELFKQAYIEITPLTEKDTSLMPSILSLKETIERNLEKLNNLTEIKEPDIAFDLAEKGMDFEPNKIIISQDAIYLYNNSLPKIFRIKIGSGETEETEIGGNINSLDSSSGTILAFSDSYGIHYQKNGQWEKKELVPPSFGFNPDLFSSYLFNIYFLNKENCYILKYSVLDDFNWGVPKKWHEDFGKTCNNPKSMTVDGSIWLLNQDNIITRYYTGEFQESIELNIFPFSDNFTEIKTNASSSYIFILEPGNNRVVLIDKSGNLVKQFRSERFDNLKSLAVSENGKTVYLLNGSVIYRIEI